VRQSRYNHVTRQRLFNILAVVSLVVWLFVAAAWASSRFAQVFFYYASDGTLLGVKLEHYSLVMTKIERWPTSEGLSLQWRARDAPPMVILPRYDVRRSFVPGIVFTTGHGSAITSKDVFPVASSFLSVSWGWPLLLSSIVFLPIPARWLQLRRRYRRRIAQALCVTCGYDLRASPDRCPECGTVPPKRETPPNRSSSPAPLELQPASK